MPVGRRCERHLRLDLRRHFHEGKLDVGRRLGAGLEDRDTQRVGELLIMCRRGGAMSWLSSRIRLYSGYVYVGSANSCDAEGDSTKSIVVVGAGDAGGAGWCDWCGRTAARATWALLRRCVVLQYKNQSKLSNYYPLTTPWRCCRRPCAVLSGRSCSPREASSRPRSRTCR